MQQAGHDRVAVGGDRAGQGDEGGDAAASRPRWPGVQQGYGPRSFDLEDQPELLFE
jgi:hypothetical protein